MFRHVVMFSWNETTSADEVASIAAGLDELGATIPAVRAYRHGPDAGLGEGNYDYVVVADFDSAADYVVYRDHPVHRAFVRDRLVPHIARRAAVQYDLGTGRLTTA